MWFCFNDAFVSVVQSDDPKILMVRARAFYHLKKLFGDSLKIHITPENDYRYRVYCDRDTWKNIVDARIQNINYTNFKDSVKDDKLHRLYEDFWYLHMIYQNGKKWWKREQKRWAQYFAEKDAADALRDIEAQEAKVK